MAFTNIQKTLTTNETDLYTAPEMTDGIVFSGIISNTDVINNYVVDVTIKLVQGDTTSYILRSVPIVFGGSLTLPKIVVKPGGKLVGFIDDTVTNENADITLGILEQAIEQ